VFPIVLGTGKRLFSDLSTAPSLDLQEVRTVGDDGIVVLTYGPRVGGADDKAA
jgi:hypothetical protein